MNSPAPTPPINFDVYAKHSNGVATSFVILAKTVAEAKAIARVRFQDRFGYLPEAIHVRHD